MPELFDDAKDHWRPMEQRDLPCVLAVADIVHPAYPEDAAVFEERLLLYREGCLVFEDRDAGGDIAAYVVSHPWYADDPPPLNAPLGVLPVEHVTYYIHDLALLPRLRGSGAGSAVVARLVGMARAAGLATLSLVAVNNSASFWQRHGFQGVTDAALARKLRSYDADAQFMVRTL